MRIPVYWSFTASRSNRTPCHVFFVTRPVEHRPTSRLSAPKRRRLRVVRCGTQLRRGRMRKLHGLMKASQTTTFWVSLVSFSSWDSSSYRRCRITVVLASITTSSSSVHGAQHVSFDIQPFFYMPSSGTPQKLKWPRSR